jgi:hypothetical protein
LDATELAEVSGLPWGWMEGKIMKGKMMGTEMNHFTTPRRTQAQRFIFEKNTRALSMMP